MVYVIPGLWHPRYPSFGSKWKNNLLKVPFPLCYMCAHQQVKYDTHQSRKWGNNPYLLIMSMRWKAKLCSFKKLVLHGMNLKFHSTTYLNPQNHRNLEIGWASEYIQSNLSSVSKDPLNTSHPIPSPVTVTSHVP